MQRPARHARLILCLLFASTTVASLIAADLEHVERLKETGSCSACDLRDASLTGLRLEKADLSGADLRGADLYGSTLTGANLEGALFEGANLKLANLEGATNAVLAGAETNEQTICPDGTAGPCQ